MADNANLTADAEFVKSIQVAKPVLITPDSKEYKAELDLCVQNGASRDRLTDAKLDYAQLVEIRKGLESGIDVERYFSSSFPAAQMEELRHEMEQGIDMSSYRKEGYNLQQVVEIREGLAAGIDVQEYADKKYNAAQMRQLRLGLEKKLPIIFYRDPSFSDNQMKEVRLGLEDNLDISLYAKSTIPYVKMRAIREATMEGLILAEDQIERFPASVIEMMLAAYRSKVDISSYLKQDFDAEQLAQMIEAGKEGLELDQYITPEMRGESLREIREGLHEGLDVSVYAKTEYNWQQMRELRKGLEARVDVSLYANPLYIYSQMREIRLGLESGVDVSVYSSMVNTASEMRVLRRRLESGEKIGAKEDEDAHPEEFKEISKEISDSLGVESSVVHKNFDGSEKVQVHYLKMTPDGQHAILRLPSLGNRQASYNVDFVLDLLKRGGITHGIKKKVVEDMIEQRRFNEDIIVAEGVPSKDGVDGYYEYLFDMDVPSEMTYLANGKADFSKMSFLSLVNVGDKLAVYHKAVHGKNGYTVKGINLYGKSGRDLPALKGHGFMVLPDHVTYCAAVSGAIRMENNLLNIYRVQEVDDPETPVNVDFAGSVWIKGSIMAGSYIKAQGDVIIDGTAERTSITAGGDVVIRNGANGLEDRASIKCGGSLYAGYLSNVDMVVEGSIHTNNIFNCNASVNGEVKVYGEEGTISGGEITSQMGVDTAFLGSEGGRRTLVRIGVTSEINRTVSDNKNALDKVDQELTMLKKEQKRLSSAGMTSREQLQWKIKINLAVSSKEQEKNMLMQKKEELDATMARIHDASCRVRDTIYEGTYLIIDGVKFPIVNSRTEKKGILFEK